MDLWFSEKFTPYAMMSIQVDRQLFSGQSDYQRIDVFDSKEFGRILVIDGYLMLTERDEFIYHEMMVHVPMAVHPEVRTVLVIGGGDGGIVRELTRYDTIEQIDMAEIDEKVVAVSRQYLPFTAGKLNDPRLSIHYQDGHQYVGQCENKYDLIIIDSTDPFGPGERLFTRKFYENCRKALHVDGIMVNQHESPFYEEDALAMQRAHTGIVEFFQISQVYQAHIPTYASGHWLFGFASNHYHPLFNLRAEEWNNLKIETGYYNTDLHRGAFALPNYVKKMLEDAPLAE